MSLVIVLNKPSVRGYSVNDTIEYNGKLHTISSISPVEVLGVEQYTALAMVPIHAKKISAGEMLSVIMG